MSLATWRPSSPMRAGHNLRGDLLPERGIFSHPSILFLGQLFAFNVGISVQLGLFLWPYLHPLSEKFHFKTPSI